MAKINRNAIAPTQGDYAQRFGINPMYQVALDVTGDDTLTKLNVFPIIGNLPEKLDMSVGSNWSSPFSKSSDEQTTAIAGRMGLGSKIGNVANSLGAAFGMKVNTKFMSAQIWEGSDPLGFTFQAKLITKTDAKKDVQDKVAGIMRLVMPSTAAGGIILKAPGPTIAGVIGDALSLEGRKITLYIGTFIAMDNCIVKNVQVEWDNRLDPKGIPISATVNIVLESFYSCFTADDFSELFVN